MDEMWEGSIVYHNWEVHRRVLSLKKGCGAYQMMSQGSSATDAVECVDTITEVDIIVRIGVHDGVDGGYMMECMMASVPRGYMPN